MLLSSLKFFLKIKVFGSSSACKKIIFYGYHHNIFPYLHSF